MLDMTCDKCNKVVILNPFTVARSDDNPDENSDNSLSSKQACQLCRENGVKRPSGCAIEACFGCLICSHLCKMRFFVECHA